MPLVPKSVKVKTAAGWMNVSYVGAPGPPGPAGAAASGWVATIDDLPGSATGHPLLLVLSDIENDDLASLRYWDGSEWVLLSTGGGGEISGYFIVVPADLAGLADGDILVWDAGDAEFEPGDL